MKNHTDTSSGDAGCEHHRHLHHHKRRDSEEIRNFGIDITFISGLRNVRALGSNGLPQPFRGESDTNMWETSNHDQRPTALGDMTDILEFRDSIKRGDKNHNKRVETGTSTILDDHHREIRE